MDWLGMILVALTAALAGLAITSRPQILVSLRKPVWARGVDRYLGRHQDLMSVRRYVAVTIASALGGLIFFTLMLGRSRGIAGILAGIAVPELYGRYMRRGREQAVDDQVRDFAVALKRALQAGLPLIIALDRLAESQPEPIRGHLAFVRDLLYTGTPFPRAVEEVKARANSRRFWLVFKVLKVSEAKGMTVQDTVETLGRLAENMAMNERLRQTIVSQTSGTRASQWLVSGLVPFVLLATLRVPRVYDFFVHDPLGRLALGLVLLLELGAFFAAKEAVRLKGPIAT